MPLAYPDPPLADDAVLLRPWTEGDLWLVEEASRDHYIPEITTLPSPYAEELAREWIDRQLGRATNDEGLSLAIAAPQSGKALGAAVLIYGHPGSADLGYWIVEFARGRGLAARAVGLLVQWGLNDAGLARVEALVEPWNVPSQRVLERVGFVREGVLRSYLCFGSRRADAAIYSLLPSDLDSAP